MRTELHLLTVLLSFVVLPLFSCNKVQEGDSLTIAETELKFDMHGGTQKVEFNSSCAWKAQSSQEWCMLSSVSGSSQATYIYVTVPANETLEARTAVITFTAGSITKKLSVFQEKGEEIIDPPGGDVIPEDNIRLREDVPIQAFYKDLFLDGGIRASSKTSLPAAEMLNLSQEYLITPSSDYTAADTLAQNKAFVGSDEDLNGYLLYPDGAPRYRCVFVNGGNATAHGRSLTEQGRENFRTFVKNGGCYIGSCAGAFVATIGSATQLHDTYIGLWPSRANNCNLSDAHTGMFIDSDSPLLKYYDFGGDNYVADVYHNGGCYCDESYMIPGTESLARYDYDVDPEEHDHMHGKTSIWAYKPDAARGRVIMSGSHPENVQSGEIRDLMAALLRYALDGQGTTSAKAILHNNETISMNKSTSDQDPAHTRIGDLQCHHFVMWIPSGTRKAKITLKPREQFKFALRLAKDSFAYEGSADYQFTGAEGETIVADIDNINEGQWYICVQCLSVPKATAGPNGTTYSSNAILNGAAYDISLSY